LSFLARKCIWCFKMLAKFKNKYIGDKAFYVRYINLAVPMIIQSFITNFVSFLDNLMVGQLGTEQLSGVAIINQFNFVFIIAIFGVVGAASIFGAQYFGKGDHKGHMYTFRVRVYLAVIITALTILLLITKSDFLIGLFLSESDSSGSLALTLKFAKEYLYVLVIGLVPFAISQIYVSAIRETGHSFMPMLAGVCSVVTNAAFDYLLIFGIGPFPELGVKGAAIATVIARFIECFIVVIWAHAKKDKNRYLEGVYRGFEVPGQMLKAIAKKGTPLMLNEMMWVLGMTALTQSYSVRGLDVVAGLNIANTITNLFNIIFIQLGSCIAIIVGQYLGAGDLKKAKDADNKMIFFSVAVCVVVALVQLFTGKFFPRIYNTSDEIKTLATSFLVVSALVMPFCSFSHCSYFTLRSGGKTGITFLFDSVFTWVIVVPTAFVLSRFTGLDIVTVYFIVSFTELIKNFIGYKMVKSDVWLVTMV